MIEKPIYVVDRDDDGEPFDGGLIAVVDDTLRRVELAPWLTVLSDDGQTRIKGTSVDV